jgi:hypothetical protein
MGFFPAALDSEPTADLERGEGAVVRLETSADEPRGGMFTTLYSCDGAIVVCAGECAEFDPFDTMEFRLLYRDS